MAILRKTSSKVVPYAVRAVSSRCGTLTNAFDQNLIVNPFSNSHHTDACKKQIDHKLAKIIKSEIKLKQISPGRDMHAIIPNDFPFKVEDKEDPWEEHATLSRDLDGEKIKVVVSIPNWELEDFNDTEELSTHLDSLLAASTSQTTSGNDDEGDGDDEVSSPAGSYKPNSIKLTVTVSKENGKITEFGVHISADDDEIKIESVSIKEPAPESGHQLISFGLHFEEETARSELEIALREYLKLRGIKASYYGFFCEQMVNKYKNIRPLVGLKMLRNFVKD